MGIYKHWQHIALSLALAGGMVGFSSLAEAQGYSQPTVRSAQQQLKNDGYYKGGVDGVDGPMTRAAIRKYQGDNNLTVNGRLDTATRAKLGIGTAEQSTEANRAATSSSQTPENSQNMMAPSKAAVSAAQRSLKKKGFYKGNVNGTMSAETQAAIREYQRNSNLNVTGQLDQGTLSSLGVSK